MRQALLMERFDDAVIGGGSAENDIPPSKRNTTF